MAEISVDQCGQNMSLLKAFYITHLKFLKFTTVLHDSFPIKLITESPDKYFLPSTTPYVGPIAVPRAELGN